MEVELQVFGKESGSSFYMEFTISLRVHSYLIATKEFYMLLKSDLYCLGWSLGVCFLRKRYINIRMNG